MSKAHDPHWRYVAFRIHGETPLSRRAVQNAVLGRARREGVPDDEAPQLTRYEWPHAIVRVHHFHLASLREWLPRITWAVEAAAKVPVRVETLSSSGTIRTLTQRLGLLGERGPAREKEREAREPPGKAAPGRPVPRVARGPAPPPGRGTARRREGSRARPPPGG